MNKRFITIQMDASMVSAIDGFRKRQAAKISRGEAVRLMVRSYLAITGKDDGK